MKRYPIFLFLLLSSTFKTSGQEIVEESISKGKQIDVRKSIIDSQAIDNWPMFGDYPSISNDGKFFKYNYSKGVGRENILVISRTDTSWKNEYPGADYITGVFSSDNKMFLFKKKDTLCFLNLKSKKIKAIPNVINIKQPDGKEGEWLAFLLNDESKTLILFNIITGKQNQFKSVTDFLFDKTGSVLLLKLEETKDTKTKTTLRWITLPNCKSIDIWESSSNNNTDGDIVVTMTLNPIGPQIAFIVKRDNSNSFRENENKISNGITKSNNELWYYNNTMDKAVLKVNNLNGINEALYIYSSKPMFSNDGKFIYFQLFHPQINKPKPQTVMVDVWSYKDTLLQCTQLEQKLPYRYTAVVGINSDKVILLTNNYQRIKTFSEKTSLVVIGYNTMGDRFWRNDIDSNWLVSLIDGSRKHLPSGNKQFVFSPEGKYILYYDCLDYNFYNYDPATEKSKKISLGIEPGILALKSEFNFDEHAGLPRSPVGIGAWTERDDALLLYDNYDIWRLDPSGNRPAVNITNGFGRKSHIKLRFTFGMTSSNNPIVFKRDESVLLTAFNTDNKYNGFYSISINKQMDPHLIIMGPNVYDLTSHNLLPLNAQNFNTGYGMSPMKAKNANIWIIKRQSTCEAPNYFLTKNFKTFKPLTNYQPQKNYNWLSAELFKWKQFDGRFSQGILYKPENFEPNKKYPVIINYYQQRTHRLYQFPTPQYTIDNIDVTWFVSRGYLVFTPDIYYKFGEPGPSAFNTVVSATYWLSHLDFVDKDKIAINGHSIGGGLTNYIITHTDKFAAALECAGASNLISASLQLGRIEFETSRMEAMEFFMGKNSIWDNPEKYIENSPIMKADKVKTPLLIMHNKIDGGMPWAQGLELFLALRRLEKPVWMLQYDNGDHSLWGRKEEAKDFTIRITQFFDYYLKGVPAPNWMVHGIPARLKGINSGYEITK